MFSTHNDQPKNIITDKKLLKFVFKFSIWNVVSIRFFSLLFVKISIRMERHNVKCACQTYMNTYTHTQNSNRERKREREKQIRIKSRRYVFVRNMKIMICYR